MKKLLLITDHKWRDLPGYVYLKYFLTKKYGIRVRLCRLGEERFWALHEKPDLVIFNHLYESSKVNFARWLKKHNVGVMILPTEGIPFEKVQELAAGKYTDLSPVDLYLSWNEPMAEKIVELGKLSPEKVKVAGVPRFDFYYPPLTRLFPGKEEVQKKYHLTTNPETPIILYATNFTIASFCDNRAFLVKDWETLKLNRVDGFRPEQTGDLIKWDALTRKLTLESVGQLLKEIPDIQIIYKPHPSENHLFYKEIVSSLQDQYPGRFAFVMQEYIWDLLNVSELLLQRTCTTAVEAWIFGKPTLQLHLHPEEFYYSKEHANGSDIVYNYNDIQKRVAYYLKNGKISEGIKEYRKNYLQKWCYKLDGKRTLEAAEIISQLLDARGRPDYSVSFAEFCSSYPREYLKQLLRYGRHLIRKRFIGTDSIGRVDKQFTGKDLSSWANRIAEIELN